MCKDFRRKESKSTPVIMITAYSSEQAKAEAYIAGCNEFVLKPIYPEKILFLLEKYLISEIPAYLRSNNIPDIILTLAVQSLHRFA